MSDNHIEKALQQAQGRWTVILMAAGLPPACLERKPGPCPMCGGKDRFTYDNRRGCGDYICRQCGAGDGITLLCKYRGWSFREAFRHIEEIANGIPASSRDAPRAQWQPPAPMDTTPEQYRAMVKRWRMGTPTVVGDAAGQYLASRSIGLSPRVQNLRTLVADHGRIVEMLARVQMPDGRPVQLHRTSLNDMVRKFMPGRHPAGSAVQLYEGRSHMGVAEGIETALSAATMFQLPVWAALTAGRLAKFDPPEYVDNLEVFADCDDSGAGQHAAEQLVNHLAGRKIKVTVRMPPLEVDWNDLLRGAMLGAEHNPRQ